MKEKILYIILAVSVGVNVGFLSSIIYINTHKPEFPCPPREFEGKGEHFERFRMMMDSVNKSNEPYIFAVENARDKLFGVLKSENPDTHTVDSLLASISDIQKELEKNIVRNMIKLRNELPEAERKMLIEFLERRTQHLKNFSKTNNNR
ncbi:MAG: hypothetical protein PHW02_06900 [bacterium]|nr:hypothetical protein [bacterium]